MGIDPKSLRSKSTDTMAQYLARPLRKRVRRASTLLIYGSFRLRIWTVSFYEAEVSANWLTAGIECAEQSFRFCFRRKDGLWQFVFKRNLGRCPFGPDFVQELPRILDEHLTQQQIVRAGARALSKRVNALKMEAAGLAEKLASTIIQPKDDEIDAILSAHGSVRCGRVP